MLSATALWLSTQTAMNTGATLPAVTLPKLSSLADWITSDTPPSPHWGDLPKQQSGTAAGRGHQVSAASTRAGKGAGQAPGKGKGELPEYAPYARKVTAGPSGDKLGFDARTSKRNATKSTATSDYFENADGSYTRDLTQLPKNYQDPSGTWQPIDTSVHDGADGRLHQAAGASAVDFARSAADTSLVHLAVDSGHTMSYGLQGAAAVAPVVSGSTATYKGVLPQTDLVLEPSTVGLKEALVIHSPQAGNVWTFPLDLKGLSAVAGKDGAITLVEASGKTQGVIPPAYAYDSKIDRTSGERGTTHQVRYELKSSQGRTALVMTLDPAWLHDAGRTFPVTVDPSYNNVHALTTYAETGAGNDIDHSMELTTKVGSFDSGPHSAISFMQFPYLGLDGSRANVSAASLTLFDVWSSTCTPERFDVAPITQAWTPSKVTSYPGLTYGASIGNLTPSVPNGCANSGGDQSKGDYLTVPLSTTPFNNWAAATGATNDYGLAVTASTADNLHWKQFASYNTLRGPSLKLTYTGALLPQILSTSPPNNSPVQTLTPQLSANGTVDNNVSVTPKFDFQIYDTSGNKLADSGLITNSYYDVPAGKLKWGQAYYWEVQSNDGTNYSAGPNWQQLTTQVPQPVIASGLSQNTDHHGFNPAIGNYTTTATDANVSSPGPSLTVTRDYNSRDSRTTGAFGTGWSSLFDAKATEQYDSAGAVGSVQVTYPDGSVIGYGRNSDGSFTAPQGRFATFKSITGGYSLTDKNATTYAFTQALGSGSFALASITDANGRAQTFSLTSGKVTTVTSAASGRALHLTWSTPAGASGAHVATVVTDPVTTANPLTWTYTYTGDQLAKVCPPTSTTNCTQYGYTAGSPYQSQVLDQGASSFWPLSESSGTTAASTVLSQQGADNGTYSNVTLGQPGLGAGSPATAAGFNGTSSSVQLPDLHASSSTAQTVSLWFKTSTQAPGVLFSYSDMAVKATETSGNIIPVLYVGTDGKLNGTLRAGTDMSTIKTSSAVTDGKWHHVALAGSWTAQTMWLDGNQVGTGAGYSADGGGNMAPWQFNHVYVGTGYLGDAWPDQPHPNSSTLYGTYFNGSIANVSFFNKPLSQASVTALQQAGTKQTSLLTSVTRPSGKAYSAVTYNAATAAVTGATDENGGSWTMSTPTVTGSSQIYRAAVLGAAPATYHRLGDAAGASQAYDEIHSGPATYNGVTLGAAGPFADNTAASFNGTSSYIQLPSTDQVVTQPGSVDMWFKMPAGNTAGGVLYDQMAQSLTGGNPTGGNWTPALYVGTDGKLYGKFWDTNGTGGMMTSPGKINDGKWHHVMLAAGATSGQALYLDGTKAGSTTAALLTSVANYTYIGAGEAGGNWPNHPTNELGYFPGSIAEVAFYRTQLTGQDASAHFNAGQNSTGLAPLQTASVTDPGGKAVKYQYDLWNGNRMVAQIDGLGNKTFYGYDTGGYLHTVTDPNGNVSTAGHDVRGNEVSKTTCQNQAANSCSTTYTTYLPDDTSAQLTPSPINDLVDTVRDGRSASATDNTYLTSYSYDALGNRTKVTTPPVAGFPSGRSTLVSYTDGTTNPAADSGFAPKGLPSKTVSPGGATTTISYFRNGDIASMTDPNGLVTKFTYDNLGRVLTNTAISDTFPAGLVTSFGYDGESRVTSQTDAKATNRVTGAVHQPQTTTVFDADGQVLSQTVADLTGGDASRTVSTIYNAYDEAATTTDATGGIKNYTYDAYGNQATVKDALGNVTAYTYDPNGHQLTQTLKGYTGDPVNPSAAQDLVTTSRAYDPAGRLQSVTDAMGNSTAYTYTDNNLSATVTRVDSTGTKTFVQQSNSYDAAGNVVQQATNNGATVTKSTLDAASRPTSTTVDPDGVNRTTTVSFTPDDKPATSTLTDASGASHTTKTTFDPMGNVTSRTLQEDAAGHPAGWWPLNQTSGTTATDASGTGNTASSTGPVSWTDGAAAFNGTTGGISTNGPVLNTAASYTVSAWANLADTSNFRTIVAQGGTNHGAFFLQYAPNFGKWMFQSPSADATSGLTYAMATAPTAPALNTWTHLVGVFNSATSTMSLYVNGVLAGTATNTSPWNANGPLTIGNAKLAGGGYLSGNTHNGQIGNVQAYSRALTAADVATLYGAGRSGGTTASSTEATSTWKLDQRGLPTSMTDPNTNTTNYTYDEAGHLTVTSAPAVNAEPNGGPASLVHPTALVGYDTFGDQTETQDPNGNTVTTAYDASGRKAGQTLPSYTPPGGGTPITGASTSLTYDKAGNLTKVTDPLTHTTSYLYDQLGDTSQVTDANNGVSHTLFDPNGQALAATDPAGIQTQATYDYLGRKVTSTILERFPAPSAITTTNSYAASAINPGGAFLASTTTHNGVTASYGYDKVGEQTQVTDGAGNTTRYTYDLQGRKTITTLPDGTKSKVTLDQLGDPLTIQSLDTDGTTVLSSKSATYDAMGRTMSATDANQHTATFTRDATGLLTGEVQPVDATHSITTSFGYDASGQRTRFTDGRGNSTYSTYNAWNLPESTIQPSVTTSTYSYTTAADSTQTTTYDAAGRPVTQTSPGGVKVTVGYDNLGNITSRDGTGAEAATASRSFTYDKDNRLLTANTAAIDTTLRATNETLTYNDRSQPLSVSGSGGTSSFAFNNDGLPTARTDASGTTAYTYDNADRLATITDAATTTKLTYSYNTLSQPSTIQYGTGNTRSYTYDHLHRLTGDSLKTSAGASVASIAYGYDGNDNETSKTTTGLAGAASNTYTYDWANRLTSWNNGTATTAYGYDTSGNRIQSGANVYTYDARNQLTGDGINTYTYSARGTVTRKTSGATPITSSSDAFDRQVTQGTQTYLSDALDRVITSTAGTGATTTFAYSGADNSVASDGVNTYTRTPGGSLLGIGTIAGGPATSALAYNDQHGDVVGNFTAASPTLSASRSYDPLGNPTATTNTPAGSLGYQSGWTDNSTGQVNMAARWYDPGVGRFMNKDTVSLDPAPNSVAANPFVYVDDNPLNRTDPSGHSWFGDAAHWVSKEWHSTVKAATGAYHTVANWASTQLNSAYNWAASAWHATVDAYDDTMAYLNRLKRQLADAYRPIRATVTQKWHETTAYVTSRARESVAVVTTTYQAAAVAVNTTTTFFQNHAAAIASFAASTAVFLGCEVAIGAATGGVGAVVGAAACGALAGEVGGAIDQGFKCMDGQSGACSAKAFGGAILLGAVGGAIGGALGGALGGKLAEAAIGKILPKLVTNTLEGAAVGGISGGATGAADYGLTCSDTSAGCSWSGAANAAISGAEDGAIGGAAGGILFTGAAAAKGRSSKGADESGPVEEGAGGSCPIEGSAPPHSFTGSTPVLMADGTAKPIDQVKAGDEVENAAPGKDDAQTHKVDKVIVTTTDHDFVDLTIVPNTENASTPSTPDQSSKARVLHRGALGLAASVAAFAAVLGSSPDGNASIVAAGASDVTTHGATLTTTYHHPFYDQTQSSFVDAQDLRPGDVLRTPTGTAQVTVVRLYHANTTTYDLTVDGLHTYYVLAGATAVLVHNCGTARFTVDSTGSASDATLQPSPGRINLASEQATSHILRGGLGRNGQWSGGHMAPGNPGKTVFPSSWSADDIMEHVSDIATDPNSRWEGGGPGGAWLTRRGNPAMFKVFGVRDGVCIRVAMEPAGRGIVSAFPDHGAC
ncbi:LamG-like jellyroll fold domain-containing protein [Streptomyces sp. G-G2]|uniref:LamG-like jellyroll fold domain-containing protein n=1 Tax=Streptomyces sp. G-G2 TaxID=3046201 RepID=UPI0024B8956F|nr:LamG-like jellyroll fold domain-containing protein [Streptomyces sp. G-G2]MDJ0383208.1 RHS repeat-associated core domain-containing protein [Streptomyces sp. G-G2]